MPFAIYGVLENEVLPLKRPFKQRGTEKIEATAKAHAIKGKDHPGASEQHRQQLSAAQAYNETEQLPSRTSALLAEQVMSAPVFTLAPEEKVSVALQQFQANSFRHMPVVSSAGSLVGIVSERDILRHMAGLNDKYQRHAPTGHEDLLVEQVMTPRVLTASVDTDVRYVARLFVEQRVGAMPVVKDHVLHGIITRSDVLSAVMRHYVLELWA